MFRYFGLLQQFECILIDIKMKKSKIRDNAKVKKKGSFFVINFST